MTKKGRNKKINIKKIKKQFKKKSLDTIICNYETIKPFYRSFIPNSIYLNKGTLYIYGNKEDLQKIKPKYQRYTSLIKIDKNRRWIHYENKQSKYSKSFLQRQFIQIKRFWLRYY